jgi:para-nitrobenzyl esterase
MSTSLRWAPSACPIFLGLALAACSRTPPADRKAADTPTTGTPAGADTIGLVGPVWRLVEFRGGDDTRLRPDDPAKYTIEFKSDGSLSARIDCNRGRGTWKSSGPALELGPLALTRAACPPGSLHDTIVKHWPYIRSYVLKDGHLHLALMADGGIYELEPSSDSAQADGATLEGRRPTASMALPPDAVFEAQLEGVSRADAPAEVIAKTLLPSPGNPPIRFSIGYDPARIQDGHAYVVRARILVDGKPFFTTTESHLVLTRGNPDSISIMLCRAEARSAATLENTYWADLHPPRLCGSGAEPPGAGLPRRARRNAYLAGHRRHARPLGPDGPAGTVHGAVHEVGAPQCPARGSWRPSQLLGVHRSCQLTSGSECAR